MIIDVEGKSVYAEAGGAGHASHCVMFLHGAGMDHSIWSTFGSALDARRFQWLAPDYPGHGQSEGPALGRVEDLSVWLHGLINSLGLKEVSLVGHSMGGLLAMEYASIHPGLLRGVSLIASGLATPVNPALLEMARTEPLRAAELVVKWSFAGGDNSRNSSLATRVMSTNAASVLAIDLKACDDYQNGKNAAAAVNCPAQVILGELDRMVPSEAGTKLSGQLQESELQVVAGSGHMVPLENPTECRSLLENFLGRHSAEGSI
ncbi:MAG: alpha/beta hydrolase [Xanthomonadales bacterium]|nr:alpha/beta hydrolase [Xanthomonadales bacterium]